MSLLLYRLGHLCARHRLIVIAIWVLAVVAVVVAARAIGSETSDDLTLPGTGSTRATDLLDDKLPKQANGTVPIVLESAHGRLDQGANRKAVKSTVKSLERSPEVQSAVSPLSPEGKDALSKDGTIGYVSVALIPFLKYPATPPAVGDGDTIGQRTILYFTFLLISVLAAAACTVLATKFLDSRGIQGAVLIGSGTYLAVVVLVGAVMPAVDEIGDFPGDVLWDFRLASLTTLTVLWATVTIALSSLIRRLHTEHVKVQARRAFAASL